MNLNNKIINLLNTTVGSLVFVLLSGIGYFLILAKFFLDLASKNALILYFFCPAIIFGSALILLKLLKQKQENKDSSAILKLFYMHIIIICIGIIFAVSKCI